VIIVPMTGFFCQDEYLSKTAKLSDDEVGRLFRACMTYHATGELIELSGRESVAFDFIRDDIDKAESAYKAKCEKNKQNRLQAIERTLTNVDERKQTKTKEEKPKREVQRFIPPTVDEVRAYCKERGNSVDPEHFVAYNENRNWTLSNGKKMKDWKLAVITWEKNNFSKPQAVQYEKKVSAQKYDQRDYHGAQETPEEMMERLMGGGYGK